MNTSTNLTVPSAPNETLAGRCRSTRVAQLRRLAVVVCCGWALVVCALATYSYATKEIGYFIALSLPAGTVVAGDTATLPDGKVVKLARPIDVRQLPPGAIAWSGEPGTVELQPRVALLSSVVLVPTASWLLLEGLALAFQWILRGGNARLDRL